MRFVRGGCRIGERRPCRVAGVPRSTWRCRRVAADQTVLWVGRRNPAAARVHSGYRRPQVLLRREGWRVNHERVDWLHREEGLALRV